MRMRGKTRTIAACMLVGALALGVSSPVFAQTSDAEIAFWNSVKESSDVAELRAYLDAYPEGKFAPIAKIRLKKLGGAGPDERGVGHRAAAKTPSEQPAKPDRPPTHDCDRLAANPYDPERATDGVGDSEMDPVRAAEACSRARKAYPHEKRFAYQLARAQYAQGDYQAARVFQTLAEDDYEIAMVHLALAYASGNGVSQDSEQAARWYREAADLGNPIALTNLGDMYWHGRGVPVDLTESLRLTFKAAKLGQPRAMANMGVKYQLGKGVKKDVAEAMRWHQRAADFGEPAAYYNLALVLGLGLGVPKDPRRAAGYMIDAIKAGHGGALNEMTKNAPAWSPEFRREIQRQLKEAGSYKGGIDGQFGRGTLDALYGLGATAKASQAGRSAGQFAKRAFTAKQEAILKEIGDVKELEKLD